MLIEYSGKTKMTSKLKTSTSEILYELKTGMSQGY